MRETALIPRKELLRQVWRLSLPVVLSNLLQSLVSVVDVYMVGRLGPIPIAAVGMSNVIRMLIFVMVLSVTAGGMSLISQAKGARDPERMSFVARQSISSGFLLSLFLLLAGQVLAQPLLRIANSGGDPTAVQLGVQYLRLLFYGMPFLVLNVIFERLMQGAGDTLTPLLITGSMNLLNIFFNYVFMFGIGPVPAFGLMGAAMGTVISRGISIAVAVTLIYSGRNVIKILPGSYRPDWRMFADIFAIGVPSGIQGLFRNGSRLFVLSILTSTEVGTYGAAALAIGLQVESLAFMPVLGLNVAGTSLVGQALGSWQTEEARRRGNVAIGLGVTIMIIFITPMILFAPAIIGLFDPSAHPLVLKAGTAYLRINTIFLPVAAVAMVANGNLRGAGDSTPGMISTMLTRAGVTLILAYLLSLVFDFGSIGVWLAMVIGVILNGLYMGLRWRGSAWLDVALHKTPLYRQHLRHLPEAVQRQFLQVIRAPEMAIPQAREVVDEEGVVYKSPEREARIRFESGEYQLLES